MISRFSRIAPNLKYLYRYSHLYLLLRYNGCSNTISFAFSLPALASFYSTPGLWKCLDRCPKGLRDAFYLHYLLPESEIMWKNYFFNLYCSGNIKDSAKSYSLLPTACTFQPKMYGVLKNDYHAQILMHYCKIGIPPHLWESLDDCSGLNIWKWNKKSILGAQLSWAASYKKPRCNAISVLPDTI